MGFLISFSAGSGRRPECRSTLLVGFPLFFIIYDVTDVSSALKTDTNCALKFSTMSPRYLFLDLEYYEVVQLEPYSLSSSLHKQKRLFVVVYLHL